MYKINFDFSHLSFLLIIFSVITIVFNSCEEEEDITELSNKIEFADFNVKEYSYKTAQVSSKIPDNYGKEIEFGHCWGLENNPDIDDSISVFSEYTSNEFTSYLENLSHNSTYFVRSYFKSGDIIGYSEEFSFKTLEIKIPVITTIDISYLEAKTVNSGGEVESENGGEILAQGVCWNTTGSPTLSDSLTTDSMKSGVFESNVENLKVNTSYYLRAYATNEVGTGYGNEISFITKDGIPEISTTEIINIMAFSAQTGGIIRDDGGLNIIKRGICWNTMGNPTLNDSIFESGSGTGSYQVNLENLQVNTTYYIKAYAVNELDTTYAEQLSFTTKDGIPEISTTSISNLTAVSAQTGGTINDDEGLDIIKRGICWNTTGNPTLNDNSIESGAGIGSYQVNLENLQINTTYYLRAYATNEAGTGYGNEVSFTTKDGIPEISTTNISNLTAVSVQTGGTINDDEGIGIIERGICWNTLGNPTLNDSIFESGSGTGFYQVNLENLQINTTYYLRAYATNEAGTGYGNEVTFTTKDGIPEISTTNISNLTAVSVQTGGTINDDEGIGIIERGICWNTLGNPTLNDSIFESGFGTGFYQVNLENLQINTTYYLRAYATNEAGTGYGNEVSFTTKDGIPEISTTEIINIMAVSAQTGGGISDDGGLDIIKRGICWNTMGNPTLNDNTKESGAGIGSYQVNLENLQINTTYYIKAYAINELDTTYAEQLSFTTKDGIPEITTLEITDLTAISAQSGGDIIDDEGLEIIESGVCWNKTGNPDISDSFSLNDISNGTYDCNLLNLEINTQYYIRAYVINELGTHFGNEISFITKDGIIDVLTHEITNISNTTASSGGIIIDDEGLEITERGVCWNTTGNPIISDQRTINGSGIGDFQSNLNNLSIGKTYFVRAYAINEIGISYGNEISFTSNDGTPVIQLNTKTIGADSAIFILKIIDDYGSISEAGILWSNYSPVTDADNKITVGTSIGEYNVDITGLQQDQKYYIKAYAENSYGKIYSEEFAFNTLKYIDGIEFVQVDGGTFVMGDNDGGPIEQLEKPEHNVTLSSFKISKFEITNAQYCDFINSIGVNSDGTLNGIVYKNFTYPEHNHIEYVGSMFTPESGYENYPANQMSWYAAKHYCEWLGGRLPTEAEWEYAARGGINHSDGFKYSGSNQIDEVAWFEDNAAYQPKKIGLKLPNQLGIYDMSGNVWEWCFDWFTLYTSDDQVNPTGSVSSYNGNKISRGGSSWVGDISCEVDYRDMREPYVAPADMGIRVVIPE